MITQHSAASTCDAASLIYPNNVQISRWTDLGGVLQSTGLHTTNQIHRGGRGRLDVNIQKRRKSISGLVYFVIFSTPLKQLSVRSVSDVIKFRNFLSAENKALRNYDGTSRSAVSFANYRIICNQSKNVFIVDRATCHDVQTLHYNPHACR